MDVYLILIKTFIANVAIMVMLTYLINLINKYILYRTPRERRQFLFILSCIAAGYISMLFGIELNDNVIIDLRFIPLIVAPMFISSISPLLIIALGIGVGRLTMGWTEAAWIGFITLLVMGIAAILFNIALKRSNWTFIQKMCISVVVINTVNILMCGFFGMYDVQEYFTKIAPIVYPLSLALSFFFVIIVRDLQLDFIRRASLIEEASRDHLTKLYNVRTFERYFNTLMEQMNQDRSQVSIAFIDVDNFKDINDAYGHSVGDVVLRKVAETISQQIRWNDFVARYGGEEFILVLPDCNPDEAYEIVERVRISIAKQQIRVQRYSIEVTVSAGIASFPDLAASELIEVADKTLYQAKAQGRNQTKHFGRDVLGL
jgi:diguanylate cyclase